VGGDVRRKSADDQALQVYVAFKETGFPAMLNTPVIGYIWDNEAPKGWSGRSTQVGGDKMRYIVLRNKTDRIGQWYTERRNIYEDYKRLFGDINGGEPLGVTTGLQIHINTQRTKTPAEGLIGDIFFTNELKEVVVAEVPREKISARTPGISAPKRKPVSGLDDILEERKSSNTGCVSILVPFETNSIEISQPLDEKMQPLLEYLVRYPRARVTLTGHADNVGSDAYNMALSQRRARAVRDYLIEKFSMDAGRLMVRGVGAAEPVASNDTPYGQAQNRCVVIQCCPEENNDHLNKE
jgi:outer membrane protein OmpA-like peptidoglycan-associated protein